MPGAAREHARPLARCVRDVLLDLGERLAVDERPLNDAFFEPVADLHLRDMRGEP